MSNNLPILITVVTGTQLNITQIILIAIIAIGVATAAFLLLRKK